ncbi:MAG: tetratricopeptide repeat protein [Gemmatimonadota bacterium]|jgi:putative nucleotidyltransferase with HDIG domain|nr:tetratricopeptide repeat protein [Gemmatimonadota bacterium]
MLNQIQASLKRIDALESNGHRQDAITVCEALFTEGSQARNLPAILEALLRLGMLYSSHEETSVAEDYYTLALEISTRTGDSLREARSLNSLGVRYQRAGDTDIAFRYFRAAQQAAVLTTDSHILGDIDVNLGIRANINGDLDLALSHFERALSEYRRTNSDERIARVFNNLGMLHVDIGNLDDASVYLSDAHTLSRALNSLPIQGMVLTNQTELLVKRGNWSEAQAHCDQALKIANQIGDDAFKAELFRLYGVIHRHIGKLDLALTYIGQAIDLSISLQRPLIEADATRELALVLREQGRNREALASLNRARTLFSSLHARHRQADINRRFRQLENDFLSLVTQWGDSIEAKDHYTQGHCLRVAAYGCKLAELSGFPEEDILWFKMGALLHDVGKVEIPEYILNKPGELTQDERLIMQRHPIIGCEILAEVEFPWDIRPMVRSHHERWDGQGYPDNLSGLLIPLSARILHVVDVYDALTTARSYREAFSTGDALEIMSKDLVSFDPQIFSVFKKMISTFSISINQENTGLSVI